MRRAILEGLLAVGLMACRAGVAHAQRDAGSAPVGNSVAALMANIHVSLAQQARIDTISKTYSDSALVITVAFEKAAGLPVTKRTAAGSGKKPADGGGAAVPPLPDSVQ